MRKITKRLSIFVILSILIGVSLIYTLFILNTLGGSGGGDRLAANLQEKIENLNSQISELEKKAKENEKLLGDLRGLQDKIASNNKNILIDKLKDEKFIPEKPVEPVKQVTTSIVTEKKVEKEEIKTEKPIEYVKRGTCEWIQSKPNKTKIDMFDVYEETTFDDIDGGAWKQGWNIEYKANQWNENNKLNIILTPHSHNDPGWLMTFEEYFARKTKDILNTVVNALAKKETRKFVWAETSYLSLWWKQANEEMRNKMRRLIKNGQLEIVTGGWVMNDEANTHYYSMIEQMVEGHEWLRANIDADIEPVNGWSIDPFGYTPTMAYLLKTMGFKHMVIQRVHYRIKKYLAENKKLEFYWRQRWDRTSNTDIFTHVMPFYSYDVPHTCGPDPKVCCQFDFKRLDPMVSCPWNIQPRRIDASNIEERVNTLVDQYRKKNQLYAHNTVFIQLGDDFRYTSEEEAEDQYINYEKLIEYMNSNKDLNVNMRFGTLKDYFELVDKSVEEKKFQVDSLTGDFFTYADRNQHYWSGYYTSRPLYKRLDRTVEYYLRAAEITFSFANLYANSNKESGKNFEKDDLYKKLLTARRHLGLFQHHDGITGTAKTAVVNDYGNKLLESIKFSQNLIEQSAALLIKGDKYVSNDVIFNIDDDRLDQETLTNQRIIDLTSKSQVVYLFNPSEHKRFNELVSLYVNTPYLNVYNGENNEPLNDIQINFIWSKQQLEKSYLEHAQNYFELLIKVDFNGFEMKPIKLEPQTNQLLPPFANVVFLTKSTVDSNDVNKVQRSLENVKLDTNLLTFSTFKEYKYEDIALAASKSGYTAQFSSKSGLLQSIYDEKTKKSMKTKMKFLSYGVTNDREKSGAYLFLPDGPGKDVDENPQWIRIEKGLLRNRVCTHLSVVVHCVELYPLKEHTSQQLPSFGIWNLVDIRATTNYELSMHIETDIDNKDFYTDLNAFQYIRRKTYSKIPLQANVYPMPSAAFINDNNMRLTILSAQSLGACSLQKSSLEVFMDRRLNQDDFRGLEQPILDNKLTSNRFLVTIEKLNTNNKYEEQIESLTHPSLSTQLASFDLVNPVIRLLPTKNALSKSLDYKIKSVNLLPNSHLYPCNLRVLNIRTMQTSNELTSDSIGVIFHRLAYDCATDTPLQCRSETMDTNSPYTFKQLFSFSNDINIKNVEKTYLTFSKHTSTNMTTKTVSDLPIIDMINPMEIQAFRVHF